MSTEDAASKAETDDIRYPKHREVRDGFHWVQECLNVGGYREDGRVPEIDAFDISKWHDPGEEIHGKQNAFILTDESSLMFDTLSLHNVDGVLDVLDSVLGDRTLDYLAISHPEANHAGNTFAILEEHPEATLIVPARGTGHGPGHGAEHELYHIAPGGRGRDPVSDIMYVEGGETIDLGEYAVEFHEPAFSDHAFTTYMTERTTNTLFTVDWMGFLHQGTDCLSFTDEFEHEVTVEQFYRFNAAAFPWIRFSDIGRIEAGVDEVIDTIDPDWIAPAHGSLVRENPTEHFELFKAAARHLTRNGEPEPTREKLEAILPSKGEIER